MLKLKKKKKKKNKKQNKKKYGRKISWSVIKINNGETITGKNELVY